MSAIPTVTAGLRPDLFAETGARALSRTLLAVALAVLVSAGFGFRVTGLGAEGFSDDELNKLHAVEDYRAHGLTAANGEHPMLMKALLTASVVVAEKWNNLVGSRASELRIPVEAAIRLPNAIFGALTAILIFLLAAELFGTEVALIAAALWSFDPIAIGFNRIAKEDTLLLFFFLLANVFWLRGQRVAESGRERPARYYWAAAAAYGAMIASKYMPYYVAISVAYYWIFQGIPATRWRLGRPRFLLFLAIIGVVFILCNPTILLPGTWAQMRSFASYRLMGRDSYEFMGRLYSHQLKDWFKGIPWYFYYVFIGVKLPLVTLLMFLVGLPLLLRRKLGDGRYFLFFWALIGFIPLTLVGGKFIRYFLPSLPIVLIIAAIGAQASGRWLGRQCAAWLASDGIRVYVRAALASLVILSSLWVSATAAPHFRLYTNQLGGGWARAGYFFPQEEFYDASVRDVMAEIGRRARRGALVASETAPLAAFYAEQANRSDLVCISLSDSAEVKELTAGDFVIVARGRRYHSNEAVLSRLTQSGEPAFRVRLGTTPAVDVYILGERTPVNWK